MLMRAKRSFPSLKSVDAGFMPSTKRPSYVAITSDLLRAPSTVSVAPEHFVSSTVVKVSIRVLKINRVRFAGAVTNARFAPLDGLPVVPVPLSTTPVLLHKPRARHEWAFAGMPRVRQASVCGSAAGVALRLHFAMRFIPPSAPLFPLADHRPKPKCDQSRNDEFVNRDSTHPESSDH